MNIISLRKALKSIGYSVKTETMSFGRVATFIHLDSGDKLTYNVMSPIQVQRWAKLFEWGAANKEQIDLLAQDGIRGLSRIAR